MIEILAWVAAGSLVAFILLIVVLLHGCKMTDQEKKFYKEEENE